MRIAGMYATYLVSGESAACVADGVNTHMGHVPLPPGEDGTMFPDITNKGGFKLAVKGHRDGHAWVWEPGKDWADKGSTIGNHPVKFDNNGNLFISQGGPVGVEGYRYFDESSNLPVTGDDTYNAGRPVALAHGLTNIWEFTVKGGFAIGQGDKGVIAIDLATKKRYMVFNPGCDTNFVNVDHQNGVFAIGVTLAYGAQGCELIKLTADQIRALPLEGGQPEKPPIDPPPPPPPVKKTMEDVSKFAAEHPFVKLLGTPKNADGGDDNARAYNSLRYVNAVAADLNKRDGAVNWGIEKDMSGDHMPTVNGQGYWADGLRTRTQGNDIVASSEGEDAHPTWGSPGDADPDESHPRGFRAPFTDAEIVEAARQRGIILEPSDKPEDPPVDPHEPPVDPVDPKLEGRVSKLEADQKQYQDNTNVAFANVSTEIDDLNARLKIVEAWPPTGGGTTLPKGDDLLKMILEALLKKF